ncbi:hypothetical protein Hanom_Chr12g01137541 [Helianthus anomalus]
MQAIPNPLTHNFVESPNLKAVDFTPTILSSSLSWMHVIGTCKDQLANMAHVLKHKSPILDTTKLDNIQRVYSVSFPYSPLCSLRT